MPRLSLQRIPPRACVRGSVGEAIWVQAGVPSSARAETGVLARLVIPPSPSMPRYIVSTPSETLTAATAKSVLSVINGSTRRAKILRIQLGGSSVTATDAAMLVELCRSDQSTAGTSTSVTPSKLDPAETAAICTAARTYTAEPTVLTVVDNFRVSPIGNTYLWELPPGREIITAVSTSFVIRVTSPATQTTNFACSILFEE